MSRQRERLRHPSRRPNNANPSVPAGAPLPSILSSLTAHRTSRKGGQPLFFDVPFCLIVDFMVGEAGSWSGPPNAETVFPAYAGFGVCGTGEDRGRKHGVELSPWATPRISRLPVQMFCLRILLRFLSSTAQFHASMFHPQPRSHANGAVICVLLRGEGHMLFAAAWR